jgi:ParB family chromosome partitioning protein
MAEEAARSRLGRGLAALIGDVNTEAVVDRAARTPRRLPVAYLRPNPSNPRQAFGAADLDDLTSSVRERGVVQPLLVRPVAGARDAYDIVAGERRWRAAQKAGLHDVPVLIREASDKEALELAIIENVQRADLNPLEEAGGYQALADEYRRSHDDIAKIVGKSRSHVTNTLRLLKLPETVKAYIRDGKISAGAARMLIGQPNPEAMAQEIVERGLNVRQVEALAKDLGKASGKSPKKRTVKNADTLALERRLTDALGLTVIIEHRSKGGVLQVSYRNLDQLDDVIRRLERS